MKSVLGAPAHWKRTTIGEIADVRLGRQRSPENHSGESMRPYLRAANVDWYRLRLDDVKEMNFTDDEMDTYRLQDGDILVVEGSGSATEVGKCAIYRGEVTDCAFQNTLIRVRPRDGIDSRWLMYRINAEAELGGFLQLARGVGIFHLGSTRTGKWPIAVPPLREQDSIVEAVERLMSHLDAGAASVEALGSKRDRLEQSLYYQVFNHASEGGLVALGDLLIDIEAGKSFKCPGHPAAPDKPGVLKLGAVTWGVFDPSENKEIPDHFTPDPRWEVKPGDLLIGRANTAELVGATALVRQTRPGLYLSDKTLRLVPKEGVPAAWLKAVLAAPQARRAMSAVATGTSDSMRNISQAKIRALQVPPPPDDAQSVLTLLEERISHVRHLAATIETASRRSDVLRRAILNAALEGRLTRQDAAAPYDHNINELEEVVA